MNKLFITLTISVLIAQSWALDHPMAYGTTARQNLAAQAGDDNEVLADALGYSNDDKSQAASYARGEGASDASVQMSADLYTDSNAVSGSTEAGSDSENGFAVSNVKSELSLDDKKALYNTNPKYWANFPGLPNASEWAAYRTYTLSTNMNSGMNTNNSTRGISSRRGNKQIGVTSNRSQNDSDGGRSVSNGLSLTNGAVNNGKVHSQIKTNGADSQRSINDLAAAQVKGIAAAVQKGSGVAQGEDSEASMIQQGDNLGFGFTQVAGSSNAADNEAATEGHIKAFYNPVRKAAGSA
jgi:hypothetical protein